MPTPSLAIATTPPEAIAADVLVVGVSSRGDEAPRVHSNIAAITALSDRLSALGVTGARDELVRIAVPDVAARAVALRSEERRVGKESRTRRAPEHLDNT